MCTVVVAVQPGAPWPVVFLGLRDESPERAWDEPGPWWPDLGQRVTGVHDREGGGAWLATARGPSRASVVLNRHETLAPPPGGWTTRGVLPLKASADGVLPAGPQTTRTFNLLTADAGGAVHSVWDGSVTETARLAPGVHLLTHAAPDDRSVPRVDRWLPRFRDVAPPTGPLPTAAEGEGSWTPWLDLLRESSALPPEDDDALVRADLVDGHLFRSLSLSTVAVSADDVSHRHMRLDRAPSVAEAIARR
ncbi:NRDE family protein [Frigoribacterium sp. VKM Ac-2836]|uniref:NRDE family protein n=1 Tax=Frigoribacterium sp. VKM Ac-2836 TaxID=2739014 RepID=UPI001565373D|nr:NRDE family protein [Frigoribacterium sp. VKM Ac-2836]NRD25929.1 NRDE family protein [Frigoribacterium sp. VKM Ac-2836]